MKRPLYLLLSLVLLGSCTAEDHFITDRQYRHEVAQTLKERLQARSAALEPFYAIDSLGEVSLAEKEALDFLYAYMPLADLTDYPTEFYLAQVRATFRAREEMPWGRDVPELLERHFVLPLRVNNENLDTARVAFYRELAPRVKNLPMQEAILEVNHWCHEKATYQPSDGRTLSPLGLVRNALGRCGEESTFLVASLRAVGIPARQVYTPRWAHTDDNHAWVEAWADGQWWFLGACEPEAVLNLGWFNSPASRAMLTHTKVFGRYYGPEETVLEGPNYTEVNLIDNYARTARATVVVQDADGKPVPGARVDFCIYNYAEFYPALAKYTDEAGQVTLSAGLGDMLAWASDGTAYGYSKISFGRDERVEVVLRPGDTQSLTIVPPPDTSVLPEVTAEQQAENERRLAQEDALRKAYEEGFPAQLALESFVSHYAYPAEAVELIRRSRGNWMVIEGFLAAAEDRQRALDLLGSLSRKDLGDVTLENLLDSYLAENSILAPRVENEFLSPYKSFFLNNLTEAEKAKLSDPAAMVGWIRSEIALDEDPKAWRIPMAPSSVWKARVADPRSRDIFFVALARTLGTDARKDPVTGKVQYRSGADTPWVDVSFDQERTDGVATPQGLLRLSYTPGGHIDNPKYYQHFTLSRIENGRPRLLTFDEGEVDMGGGMDWEHAFGQGVRLDAGRYLLTSGNRLSDGTVPVTIREFDLPADGETSVELTIDFPEDHVSVIGGFDSESCCSPEDGVLASVLSLTGRGFYVLGIVEPGKEPSNHALRDLAAEKEALEAWGQKIVLLCADAASLAVLRKDLDAGKFGTLPSTVVFATDPDGSIRDSLVSALKLRGSDLPVFIIADSFNKVYFASEGYTIGLGAQILGTIAKL